MSWPSSADPWYVHNQADNNTRRAYYDINGIPVFKMDGTIGTLPSNGGYIGLIEARLNRESPYLIELFPELQGDNNIHVPVVLTLDEALPASMKIYIALVEEFHHLSPPGPNGIADYHYNMLDMHPNASGITITGGAGETVEMEAVFPYEAQYPLSNLAIVAWIQSTVTNEVFQAQFTEVPSTTPFLEIVSYQVLDGDASDPNGRPDPGETVNLSVTLANDLQFLPTENLVGTLTCDNENVIITDGAATWATIEPGAEGTNSDDLFTITVPEEFTEAYVTFTVSLVDDSGYEAQVEFVQLVGRPDILLVNDFGAGYEDYDTWFALFQGAGLAPEIYSDATATQYGIDQYSTVIWATSTDEGDVLTELEIGMLTEYMSGGGHLILTGEEVGEDEGGSEWFSTWFKVAHRLDAPPTASQIRLVPHANSPFSGMDLVLVGGTGHSTNPSTLTLQEGAVPFFKYISTTEIGASGYRSIEYAAIYLAFNMQAVSGLNSTTTASELLNGLIAWMEADLAVPGDPGETALPATVQLETWPNPFNASLTVNFALPKAGDVQVSVFNLLGQEVARLAHDSFTAGQHTVSWQAGDAASGIYLVRVATPSETVMRKVSLIK